MARKRELIDQLSGPNMAYGTLPAADGQHATGWTPVLVLAEIDWDAYQQMINQAIRNRSASATAGPLRIRVQLREGDV